ncbi:PfkB family carbohydrate kinase [Propionibacteriaceae bacterium G1746]|uniref:PfkB family carbohydrate kinase n=1 Tax=Aestuariimicrobium sp. G57 TaxID=3418485 RepID=UPI003C1F5883
MELHATRTRVGRVIHTAQALIDAVAEVPSIPRRGGNVMATDFTRYAAGAVNILLAAHRQGAECVHAGAIGTGPNGDLIRRTLSEAGISLAGEPVLGLDSGICFVMVEPGAERTFVTTLGAERQLSIDILQASNPRAGDVVCVSGYSLAVESTRTPLLTWLSLLPDGVGVVLDPGAAFAELPDDVHETMLALTTVWTGNLEETEALTGVVGMEQAAAAAADRLPTGSVIIVRDGARGCAVHAEDETVLVPGFPQTAVDTNGAGDCHTGAFIAARQHGDSWPQACLRANAAAAIKVTRRGPDTAPTQSEVDAFLAGHGA